MASNLQLLVEHDPGGCQQAVLHVRGQLGAVGEDHRVLALLQRDRPDNGELLGLRVIGDLLGRQVIVALHRLDIAGGDQRAGLGDHARTVGDRHERHELRLRVGGKGRVRRGTDVHCAAATAAAVQLDPICAVADLAACRF